MSEPIYENPIYEERIEGYDKGLINAWQVGRNLAVRDPDIVARARNGELCIRIKEWRGNARLSRIRSALCGISRHGRVFAEKIWISIWKLRLRWFVPRRV